MKKRTFFISVVIIAVLAALVITRLYKQTSAYKPNPVWVQTSAVKEAALPQEAHAIGTLVARSVEITPDTSGHVEAILFKDGAHVKRGDVLIKFDDVLLTSKLESVKASLSYLEGNYKRMLPLSKRGYVSRDDLEKVEAELKKKRAELRESETMLSRMRLTAPFDGVVGKCKVSPGEYINAGQSVVTVTNLPHLRVEYSIPEKYLSFLKLGQGVKITSSAYPDKIFTGTVTFISPTISSDNRSVQLYAEVKNENNELAPGMFVDVVQSLGTQMHALVVPVRSLVPVLDGEEVYKVVDGKAYAVKVRVGKRTETEVQIEQGLTLDDMVITDGQLKVRNAMPVNVKT
jgi:membrane fusion protein (multidrug efflux system)